MTITTLHPDTLDRMEQAVERVRDRLLRCTTALDAAGIPYAVIGGNAVAAWVAQVDRGAVRTTRDVDLLIDRSRLTDAIKAMESAGWIYAQVDGVDQFLDGPDGMPSEGIHLVFAGEKVKPTHLLPAPQVRESIRGGEYQFLNLEALVRMKLVAHRLKDRVHLQDLAQLKMIDESWPDRFPEPLAERLRAILTNPYE